jgi:20S proteasome subunit beta 1
MESSTITSSKKINDEIYDPNLYFEKSLGTTIIAVIYSGGVMLAADARTSSGQYVANRVADKIWPITSNIFALKCGSAADTQFLLQTTKGYMAQFGVEYGDKPPVKVAARILQQYQYQYKNYLNCAVIVCGYDNLDGASIYEVGMGGTVTKRIIAMNGSGSHYINGYVDKNFKENMTKEEAKEFLKSAVTLDMFRDSHSGGIIRLLDITKDGFNREYIPYKDIKVRIFH